MARADGTNTSGTEGGNSGGDTSIPVVDIGAAIDAANASAADASATSGKRVRRTRAELEAAGYYNGTERKETSRPAAKVAKGSIDVNSVQFALTGIHALLAAGMHAPELELSETEAETVAKNIVAVTRHYDLQQTQKATDWGNLVVSLGVVYGGRIIRISARTRSEKAARRGATAASTGFSTAPVNHAPQQPQVREPPKQGPPAPVATRPRTREDDELLNEQEPFLAP